MGDLEKTKEIKGLIEKQAGIRVIQRERLYKMHDLVHGYERNVMRKGLCIEVSSENQDSKISDIHEMLHDFLHGFDEAVLIHERIAIIEGRDPSIVNKSITNEFKCGEGELA